MLQIHIFHTDVTVFDYCGPHGNQFWTPTPPQKMFNGRFEKTYKTKPAHTFTAEYNCSSPHITVIPQSQGITVCQKEM